MAVAAALYSAADEKELARKAKESLLHYGSRWFPEFIINSSGQYVTTISGHRMLDWTSGQMSCLIGHGHPEIVQTINDHAANLDHLFSGMLSPPVVQLAHRLTSLTPPGLDKAFFLNTGGESNEAAIRLAKFYTGKFEIVGLASSWHGMTGSAIGAQYHAGSLYSSYYMVCDADILCKADRVMVGRNILVRSTEHRDLRNKLSADN